MKRPFGVLAENATADFALLLLEPVRSAEPARNSIGIAAAIASIADSRGFAGGDILRRFQQRLLVRAQRLRQRGRALVPQPPLELGALAGAEFGEARFPFLARGGAAAAGFAPGLQHVVGHRERLERNAELFLGALEFVGAERLAMGLRGAGPGRRAVADGGLAGDQRRLVGFLRAGDRGRDRLLDPGRRSVRPPSRRT